MGYFGLTLHQLILGGMVVILVIITIAAVTEAALWLKRWF